MMNKLQLVVFDCDGVMFDSKEANRQYYNDILAKFGHPEMSDEEVEFVHTHNVMESISYIFRHYPDDLPKADEYRTEVDYTPYLAHMKMEPDLVEFLDFLKPHYKLAISTSRTTTMPLILEMFGLADYFGKVMTALDVTHPKPHPEALLEIMSFYGVTPDETIYIGDSIVDREHSRRAKVDLIAFRNTKLPAEYHVSTFSEARQLPIFHL
jgi:HAD superfamily hydrolase (TIGR01509 family)